MAHMHKSASRGSINKSVSFIDDVDFDDAKESFLIGGGGSSGQRQSFTYQQRISEGGGTWREKAQVRVWKCLSDPPSDDKFAKFIFYTDAALCIYLVVVGILSTDHKVNHSNKDIFNISNSIIVVLMTFEHALRLWSCTVVEEYKDRCWGRVKWQLTVLALVDLVVIVSFYVGIIFKGNGAGGSTYLATVNIFRFMRITLLFRSRHVREAFFLLRNVVYSRWDDLLASGLVLGMSLLVVSFVMYITESLLRDNGTTPGFSSVPEAMYWATITLTTIGYGDAVPKTTPGKVIVSLVAIYAVCIGAIPVGIISSGYVEEIARRKERNRTRRRVTDGTKETALLNHLEAVSSLLGEANFNTYTSTELRRINEILVNGMGRMNSHVLQTMGPENAASNRPRTSSEPLCISGNSDGRLSGNGSPGGSDAQNGDKYGKLPTHEDRESMGYDPPIPDESLGGARLR